MALAHRVIRTHFYSCWVACVTGFLERDVFGNVHNHRSRASATGNVKSFFQNVHHIAHILDQEIVFDDGSGDAYRVAFLESIQTNGVCGDLAGDDDHGDAVHVGSRNASDSVGDTRAGSHQCNTDISGCTGVAIGCMHCSLFVAHEHVLNSFLLVERIVNMQHSTTGVAPYILDVFCLKCFDQNV